MKVKALYLRNEARVQYSQRKLNEIIICPTLLAQKAWKSSVEVCLSRVIKQTKQTPRNVIFQTKTIPFFFIGTYNVINDRCAKFLYSQFTKLSI